MPKDYKHSVRIKDKSGKSQNGMLPFITGLVIGLFVAFVVFLSQNDHLYKPFDSGSAAEKTGQPASPQQKNAARDRNSAVPAPKFDFYDILPNKEINISEWIAEEQTINETGDTEGSNVYILQVGSFRQYEAADQVKAQLALIGVVADIQRVVINGQDTRYRVRVGPYQDQKKLDEERRRLQENKLEYMLLKLRADDAG